MTFTPTYVTVCVCVCHWIEAAVIVEMVIAVLALWRELKQIGLLCRMQKWEGDVAASDTALSSSDEEVSPHAHR